MIRKRYTSQADVDAQKGTALTVTWAGSANAAGICAIYSGSTGITSSKLLPNAASYVTAPHNAPGTVEPVPALAEVSTTQASQRVVVIWWGRGQSAVAPATWTEDAGQGVTLRGQAAENNAGASNIVSVAIGDLLVDVAGQVPDKTPANSRTVASCGAMYALGHA